MGGFGLPFYFINSNMTNRILSCPFPENLSPLSPNGYRFSIQKIPELSYFCQEVQLPDLILGDILQANPLTNIALPGDQVAYSPLEVSFLIDNKMSNYKALYNWVVGLGFPQDNDQYQNLLGSSSQPDISDAGKVHSDGTLIILDNMSNPIQTIQFIDMVPVSLGSLTFTSTSQDVQYLVGRASFRYTYYQFI